MSQLFNIFFFLHCFFELKTIFTNEYQFSQIGPGMIMTISNSDLWISWGFCFSEFSQFLYDFDDPPTSKVGLWFRPNVDSSKIWREIENLSHICPWDVRCLTQRYVEVIVQSPHSFKRTRSVNRTYMEETEEYTFSLSIAILQSSVAFRTIFVRADTHYSII